MGSWAAYNKLEHNFCVSASISVTKTSFCLLMKEGRYGVLEL